MLKIFLRTLLILLAAGLIAGGIYLFAANGGISGLGSAQQSLGLSSDEEHGAGRRQGQKSAQVNGSPSSQRAPQMKGGDRDGQMSFSLASLSGLAVQAGKIAAVTAFIVAVQFSLRLLQRRRRLGNPGHLQQT
jgi:hypothetical protein